MERSQVFEGFLRNDRYKCQGEDVDLIVFPVDSIQVSMKDDSLHFGQNRYHDLQHPFHGSQNAIGAETRLLEQKDETSTSSRTFLKDHQDDVTSDAKQITQQWDHKSLRSSHISQTAADLFWHGPSPSNLDDVLRPIPQLCDDIFPFPTGDINYISGNNSQQFQRKRDRYMQHPSSHRFKNVIGTDAHPFEQLDETASTLSWNVLTNHEDVVKGESKRIRKQQDQKSLRFSHYSQPAEDPVLRNDSRRNPDVLRFIPRQPCDYIFPFLHGGINDVFWNGCLIYDNRWDRNMAPNVIRGNSK